MFNSFEETVSVNIRRVEDGMQLKVPNKGNDAPEMGSGDLLVAY